MPTPAKIIESVRTLQARREENSDLSTELSKIAGAISTAYDNTLSLKELAKKYSSIPETETAGLVYSGVDATASLGQDLKFNRVFEHGDKNNPTDEQARIYVQLFHDIRSILSGEELFEVIDDEEEAEYQEGPYIPHTDSPHHGVKKEQTIGGGVRLFPASGGARTTRPTRDTFTFGQLKELRQIFFHGQSGDLIQQTYDVELRKGKIRSLDSFVASKWFANQFGQFKGRDTELKTSRGNDIAYDITDKTLTNVNAITGDIILDKYESEPIKLEGVTITPSSIHIANHPPGAEREIAKARLDIALKLNLKEIVFTRGTSDVSAYWMIELLQTDPTYKDLKLKCILPNIESRNPTNGQYATEVFVVKTPGSRGRRQMNPYGREELRIQRDVGEQLQQRRRHGRNLLAEEPEKGCDSEDDYDYTSSSDNGFNPQG